MIKSTVFNIRKRQRRFLSLTGFTLIEVMMTTAVLSLAAVLIYEAFFHCLDSFNYCVDYLNFAPLANEKIWQAQDALGRFGTLNQIQTKGESVNRNKKFIWNLSYGLIGGEQDLYKIDLVVFWQAGQRKVKLSRAAYAMYEEEEEEEE